MLAWLIAFAAAVASPANLPRLQSGDIIVHRSQSNQANAVMQASDSPWTHIGLIEVRGDTVEVLEAVGPVKRTPLKGFIARSKGGKFAIYRVAMTDAQRSTVLQAAHSYLGRGYDIHFSDQNGEIYCSELVALAFDKAGIQLGSYQQVKSLNVQAAAVQRLLQVRGPSHPACRGKQLSWPACRDLIYETRLITPDSIARDSKLTLVHRAGK